MKFQFFSLLIVSNVLANAIQNHGDHCKHVGSQKCLDSNEFAVCSSGQINHLFIDNVWVTKQCAAGTKCQHYPGDHSRVLCGYKRFHKRDDDDDFDVDADADEDANDDEEDEKYRSLYPHFHGRRPRPGRKCHELGEQICTINNSFITCASGN